MTVRELIEELEEFDGDMEVVFKPSNSNYVDSIREMPIEREISSFYGEDRKAVVILSDGQTGAV